MGTRIGFQGVHTVTYGSNGLKVTDARGQTVSGDRLPDGLRREAREAGHKLRDRQFGFTLSPPRR